jgi:hypothetical protein
MTAGPHKLDFLGDTPKLHLALTEKESGRLPGDRPNAISMPHGSTSAHMQFDGELAVIIRKIEIVLVVVKRE